MTDRRDPSSDLAFDMLTGGLRMGAAEQQVGDPADAEQVYGAYLSLLYAVRGARRGEEVPLRSTDLDFLLAVVGEDPEQIERRLVELMGCTAEEATLLRRVLVRHRNLAASVGAVAGLSLVALLGPSVASATAPDAPSPSPSPAVVTPADPTELPPLTTYLTTDDGAHVPVPEAWDPAPAPEAEGEVVVASSASPQPSVSPSAVPSPAPVVTHAPSPSPAPVLSSQAAPAPAAPVEDVVLGEPMTPIDRPGEVVLGEPMTPIDRPGWSPVDEVVLGEPMTPIDRVEVEPVDEGTPGTG